MGIRQLAGQQTMSHVPVKIYTTPFCPYCIRARALLQRKSIVYEEIDVSGNPTLWTEMERLSKRNTVPQIFINGVGIGGYDDMAALERAGKLDALLYPTPSQ